MNVALHQLEFRRVDFCEGRKGREENRRTLGARKRTNNKLNPHMTPGPGIEPEPHW